MKNLKLECQVTKELNFGIRQQENLRKKTKEVSLLLLPLERIDYNFFSTIQITWFKFIIPDQRFSFAKLNSCVPVPWLYLVGKRKNQILDLLHTDAFY